MACQPDKSRGYLDLRDVHVDRALIEAAQRYADAHMVSVSDVVECALTLFMVEGHVPVEPKWCALHRCSMIVNSSGTVIACPVEEGEIQPPLYFKPEDVFPHFEENKAFSDGDE